MSAIDPMIALQVLLEAAGCEAKWRIRLIVRSGTVGGAAVFYRDTTPVRRHAKAPPVVAMTARAYIDLAMQTMRRGVQSGMKIVDDNRTKVKLLAQ